MVLRFEIAMSGLMRKLNQLGLSWSRALRLAFALLCFGSSAGSARAASTGPQSWPVSSTQATSQFAIADFDGDNRPDLATIQIGHSSSWDTHYWIAFQLSGGSRQTLGITAPTGGLQITSRDVNGDNFPDIVVTTAWTYRPVAVLLNDGRGKFSASSPSAFPGAFSTSEKSRLSTKDEIQEATAVLLSRYRTGNCSEVSWFLAPQSAAGLLVPWGPRGSALTSVVSFLGRAPPSFVPHI